MSMGTLPIKRFKNQNGQALLLVLLAMSVVLVLGLSIVSRTITDVSNTTRQEDSTRAFSAAESGVEKALLIGGSTGTVSVGAEGATFTATVAADSASTDFNYPLAIPSGDMAHLWFLNHDANGNFLISGSYGGLAPSMDVCWGNQGSTEVTAAEIIFFYTPTAGNYSDVRVWKGAYDPDAARRGINGFLDPGTNPCTVSGKVYKYSRRFRLGGGPGGLVLPTTQGQLLFAKVRLLYNSVPQDVGFFSLGGVNFPSQGNKVSSTGTAGGANRRLEVTQLFGEPPAIFSSLIYSGADVTHN